MKRRSLLQAGAAALTTAGLMPARASSEVIVKAPQTMTHFMKYMPNGRIPDDAHRKGVWIKLPTIAGLTGSRSWPINPIHMALLPNGRVLSYGSRGDVLQQGVNGQDGSQNVVWNPDDWTNLSTFGFDWTTDSRGQRVPFQNYTDRQTANVQDARNKFNSFCSGGTLMPNGKLLMVGGSGGLYTVGASTAASKMTGTYDYVTKTTVKVRDSVDGDGRWYASLITLADGRQMVLGGMEPYAEDYMDANLRAPGLVARNTARAPMIYKDGQGWSSLPGIPMSTYSQFFELYESRAEYPRAWVAPGGKVFGISTDLMWSLDPTNGGRLTAAGSGKFSNETLVANDNRRPASELPNVGSGSSSAVMYDKGLVMQAGGNGYWVLNTSRASSKATVVDIRGGADSARVILQPPMKHARKFFNATVLPTGSVLVNGGTTQANVTPAQHVREAEMFVPDTNNPASGSFVPMASQAFSRVYHATAILLPDGTVLSAGGGNPHVVQRNGEIFLPPYLFTAQGAGSTWALRPTLTRHTAGNAYHGALVDPFHVEMTDTSGANNIKDVVLVGLSTVTHGFNNGQRRIPLDRSDWAMGMDSNKNHVRIDRFPTADLTPPGYYMLFLINDSGVPSRGVIVAMGAGTAAPQPA